MLHLWQLCDEAVRHLLDLYGLRVHDGVRLMGPDISAVVSLLHSRRFPLTNEKVTQEAIAVALRDAGFAFERERRLGDLGLIDFLVEGIGIEVKLRHSGGSRRAIFRQCQRYAEHEDVRELIVATNMALGLPDLGKPARVVSLGTAWL